MDIDLSGGSVLPVITDADPMLKRPSAAIGEPTDDIHQLARDMLATMYAQNGIGLAAVQVARPVRMLVFDVTPSDRRAAGERKPEVAIDPEITWSKKLHLDMEGGCLSIPGRRMTVSRPSDVDVEYTDLAGARVRRKFGGMQARVFQHELDHLNGVLITDRAA